MADQNVAFEVTKSIYGLREDLTARIQDWIDGQEDAEWTSEELADHLILAGWIDLSEVRVG